MKKPITLPLLLILMLAPILNACSSNTADFTDIGSVSQTGVSVVEESSFTVNDQEISEDITNTIAVDYDSGDLDSSTIGSDISTILLEGDDISFQGSGATVDGNTVTITVAGTYMISGILNDGQVIVDSQDAEIVKLVLNGAEINSSTSAPLYIRNAEKTVITLADGTENAITDGTDYVFEEADEPNAALFSKADLTINGSGSLTVNANFNNGITSKDDLKIVSGEITINSANDGIKGRDSVAVKDGTIVINAGGDGIQSNNDVDGEKGNVYIEGGNIQITAQLDGIQAEQILALSGGDLVITTGGGSANGNQISQQWGDWDLQNQTTDTESDVSVKGLKAGTNASITGGILEIDSADDAIHSNDTIRVYDGELLLASGDDGLHADSVLEIYGGTLNITQSYEGIESADIQINGGSIHLIANDDGINGSSGNGGDAMGGGPRGGGFESGDNSLVINGGHIFIDAGGDGFDINGPIEMTDGVVLINGPTNTMNGALDYSGSFNITGGFLIAVGSADMPQAPSESSTQYSVMYNFDSIQTTGTLLHIESQSGDEIITFSPTKEYQSVVVTSPELTNGSTYLVYSGGSSTGSSTDGLYSGGTYSPGTQVDSFTLSSVVTTVGAVEGVFMGGPGGRPSRRP